MSATTALDEPLPIEGECPSRQALPRSICLDANATTAPLREVTAAVLRTMRSGIGNPASAHHGGSAARRVVETARDRICDLVTGAEPESIIFVSGGTEANNSVIESFVRDPLASFVAAPVEHSSVYEPLRNRCANRVSWTRVDSSGRIDADDVRRAVERAPSGPVLLVVQAANSETGVIQPVAEIVRAARAVRPDTFIHLDAAQGIGRVPLSVNDVGINTLSFSGHKLHGPAGTGALVIASGEEMLRPFILGGGQEQGLRSGTLNVPGIVGLGVAAQKRAAQLNSANDHMGRLRDAFEAIVQDGLGRAVAVNGALALRVSNTSNLCFRSVDAMQLLACLDAHGIMASQGSACSAGRPEPSRVLRGMGLTEQEAFSSVRFSFSVLNTIADAQEGAAIVVSAARKLAQ